jgi:hypothetical protein
VHGVDEELGHSERAEGRERRGTAQDGGEGEPGGGREGVEGCLG